MTSTLRPGRATHRPVVPAVEHVRPLASPRELLVAQLSGIRAWQDAHDAAVAAVEAPGLSRELRLDAARALRVRQREQQALREQASRDREGCAPVAVLAHHHAWTRQGLRRALTGADLHVLDVGEDGAAAVGTCVAEQPCLLVLDDTLAMRSGVEVVRETRRFCPHTVVVGHVSRPEAVGPLLDAGAHLVLTRSVRPDDVAARALALLDGASGPGA